MRRGSKQGFKVHFVHCALSSVPCIATPPKRSPNRGRAGLLPRNTNNKQLDAKSGARKCDLERSGAGAKRRPREGHQSQISQIRSRRRWRGAMEKRAMKQIGGTPGHPKNASNSRMSPKLHVKNSADPRAHAEPLWAVGLCGLVSSGRLLLQEVFHTLREALQQQWLRLSQVVHARALVIVQPT